MTEEFLLNLSQAYSKVDYSEFLNRTGLSNSSYSLDKFQQFKRGAENLLKFDSETLENIISNGRNTISTFETVA